MSPLEIGGITNYEKKRLLKKKKKLVSDEEIQTRVNGRVKHINSAGVVLKVVDENTGRILEE